jgi:DNA-binding PadR family transcriptional regulator
LEAEGLIASEYEERRKYYRITPKGKKALHEAKEYMRRLAAAL